MTLYYHNTDKVFESFLPRPCFFNTDLEENLGYMRSHPGSVTMVAAPIDPDCMVISPVKVTETLAWEFFNRPFMYSMFDSSVGEFPKDQIARFVTWMGVKGYHGSLLVDYAPEHHKDTISLVVFRPDLTLKLTHMVKGL